MKVRILRRVPVEAKHGIEVGGEYDVVREVKRPKSSKKLRTWSTGVRVFVKSPDTGEEVGLKAHEFEEVKEPAGRAGLKASIGARRRAKR